MSVGRDKCEKRACESSKSRDQDDVSSPFFTIVFFVHVLNFFFKCRKCTKCELSFLS